MIKYINIKLNKLIDIDMSKGISITIYLFFTNLQNFICINFIY